MGEKEDGYKCSKCGGGPQKFSPPLTYRNTTVTSTERKQLARCHSNLAANRAGTLQSWPRFSAFINALNVLLSSFFPSGGRLQPRVIWWLLTAPPLTLPPAGLEKCIFHSGQTLFRSSGLGSANPVVFGATRKCLKEVAGWEGVALLTEQRASVWELPLSHFLPLEKQCGNCWLFETP